MEFATAVGSVDIYWLGHASVKLVDSDGFTVYIDPWSEVMEETFEDKADIIISTHDHQDHFDIRAIQQIKKRDTILVCVEESEQDIPEDISHDILKPNRRVKSHGKEIRGVPAYNVDKFRSPDVPYHPEGEGVGVIFELDGTRFYHAGDTDLIPEMDDFREENIDVAFLPVGGTYTMDQEEAIEAIKAIRPGKVVPIHYGYMEETTLDADKFERDVRERTDSEPLILEPQSIV